MSGNIIRHLENVSSLFSFDFFIAFNIIHQSIIITGTSLISFFYFSLLLLNEYFNRIILQSYHTYTYIYTVISEVLHKKLYKKLKSRSIINNILKFKILKFKTLRSQKSNSQKRKSQRLRKRDISNLCENPENSVRI